MHACYHRGMEQMTRRAPADLIERFAVLPGGSTAA